MTHTYAIKHMLLNELKIYFFFFLEEHAPGPHVLGLVSWKSVKNLSHVCRSALHAFCVACEVSRLDEIVRYVVWQSV